MPPAPERRAWRDAGAMQSPGDFADHPRVKALIERFQSIDAAMRDLPLYNGKLAIKAIGFGTFGDDALLGVLLTPWFMNLMLLPIAPAPLAMADVGKAVLVELPAGKRAFVTGGDEVIGLYRAHSLHSPVLNFTLPGQAQAEARRMLTLLMTPAAESAATNGSRPHGIDRRALLFGRGPAPIRPA